MSSIPSGIPASRRTRPLAPALAAATALALSLPVFAVPAFAATPLPGQTCATPGARSTGKGGVVLRCTGARGRAVWRTQLLPRVAPAPEAAVPSTTTPASTPTTVASPTTLTTAAAAPSTNLTSGCTSRYDSTVDYFPDKATISEAVNLQVRYERNYKVVTVPAAYRSAKPASYVLVQCGTPAPKLDGDLVGATVVNVPISTAAIMSTTLAPPFDIVGAADAVVAVDDPLNYSTPSIVERIAAGKIKTVGNNAKANVEALITLKPSVVLTYASGDPTFDGIDKLQQAGLTVVVEGSSQEQTPLGRAEWTKLIGLLTNREKTAQTAYARLRTDYRTLAAKASVSPNKPGVIVGSMFAGTWYMPGGKSFPAQLVRDAGGSYAWSTDGSTGSLALDYEAVVEKAYDATVWINAGYQWANLNSVTAEDPRYARLTPYKVGNVWGNDRRVNATGGSDYFETAVVRPDLVLADLVAVLHPELVPGHEPVFYRHIPRAR